ncbi:hypothetical protein [Kineococcus gypseus]|uniref:hypothetical protein n=1 Tax=Kineococcus gypseus TaxID=1637102 RepID=UPI003D7C79D7
MIAGALTYLLAVVVTTRVLRIHQRAVQAHWRALRRGCRLLAPVAVLVLTASGWLGGWWDDQLCTGSLPGYGRVPEGASYRSAPTLLPVGVRCTVNDGQGSHSATLPGSWWLSVPTVGAVVLLAAATTTLVHPFKAAAQEWNARTWTS